MDHLPPVAEPHNPIVVPFLGGRYTGHGFTNFELPAPLSFEILQQPLIPSHLAELAAPVLQTWFFFGLLHEVLELSIEQADFVETTVDHGTVITTAKLKDYLARWKAQSDTAGQHSTSAHLVGRSARAVNCLHTSYTTWVAIPRFADIVGEEVQLSIHILASALENALYWVWKIPVGDLPWRRQRSNFLVQRMLQDEWCPAMIEQAAKRSSVPWHYYASLCPPSITHGPEYDCVAGDIECKMRRARTTVEDYAPKHVCESGNCAAIQASPSGLIEVLIESGEIPLLEYDEVTTELRVLRYEEGMQYTAISHVWTDGMGNAEHNDLPKCQLERLKHTMSKVPWTNKCTVPVDEEHDNTWHGEFKSVELIPDVKLAKRLPLLFWIDTICSPLEGPLRHLAINSMRRVYNRANRVLVFDVDLVRVRGTLSAEEFLTRISLSNWRRRFWTLQEAVLAKILWYQFGDEVYRQLPFSSMLDQEPDIANNDEGDSHSLLAKYYFDNEVHWYADDFNFDLRRADVHSTYGRRLALVWSQLEHRISRYESDRPICIATLMDMDLDDIQSITEGDRMREIWRFYEAVPTGVLFAVCPRFENAPYRWAPKSLTRLAALPPPGHTTEALRTDRGLEVTHYGIITTSRLRSSRKDVISMKVGERVYLIRQNLKQENTPWEGLDFQRFDHLAVLISEDKVEEGGSFPQIQGSLGALVGVTSSMSYCSTSSEMAAPEDVAEEVIECEYLRAVSVLLKGSPWETRGRSWSVEEEKEKLDEVPAKYSAVRQKWLVT